MSRKRLPWIMVGVCSLAFVTQAVGQECLKDSTKR